MGEYPGIEARPRLGSDAAPAIELE
jgi:hypothetical protein